VVSEALVVDPMTVGEVIGENPAVDPTSVGDASTVQAWRQSRSGCTSGGK
jgi:hypothetical protein